MSKEVGFGKLKAGDNDSSKVRSTRARNQGSAFCDWLRPNVTLI